MKKLLQVLLSLSLSGSLLSVSINAESRDPDITEPILVSETIKTIDGQEANEYVYLIENELYITEVLGNEIFVYDEENNLIVSAVYEVSGKLIEENFSLMSEISTNALVDDYDEWLGWRTTQMVQFVPQFSGSSITSGTLSALISAAFTGAAITISGLAISVLCSVISDSIVNGVTVYVKGDYNYNKHCNILRKERVNQYNANGTVKVYGTEVVNWLSTPWDYTTPTACRVLTERY